MEKSGEKPARPQKNPNTELYGPPSKSEEAVKREEDEAIKADPERFPGGKKPHD